MIEWGQEDKRGMTLFWLIPLELRRKPTELSKLGLDQEPKTQSFVSLSQV